MLRRIWLLGAERFIALLLVAFAMAELYAALQLSLSEEFTLGPGAMPVIYSVALLIFAGILAIWPSQKASPVAESPVVSDREAVPVRNYRIGVLAFALVVVFIVSIYLVGFFAGTIIFSLLYTMIVLRWPAVKAAGFALIWGVALYYGFDRLLGVQLESGILFGS